MSGSVSPRLATPVRTPAKYAFLQPGVLVGALIPLAVLIVRSIQGTLGADPIAVALNQLGLLALIMLVSSLLATPLKRLFGVTWPIRIRRLLGLLSFFHAALHVLLYAIVDQGLDARAISADVTERPFIALGALAFLTLIPLALTSTSRMLKRLGARRWKRLHRLAYLAGLLGCLHFILRVKKDLTEPLIYVAILALALAIRLLPDRGARPRHEDAHRAPRQL